MFGSIVLSLAGRDKDNYFVITEIQDNFAYIVDGKIHKVENPKLKKLKHMTEHGTVEGSLLNRLKSKAKITNQDIKKSLKRINNN